MLEVNNNYFKKCKKTTSIKSAVWYRERVLWGDELKGSIITNVRYLLLQ
jgi:hypothetical protein